jgi:antitoxin ParD1/3/4
MNISLPEPLKEFVDEQVNSGRYSSASDYVRELIREDARRKVGERLEAVLLEGLNSGDPIPVTAEFWEERRSELFRRADRHQKNDVKK